MVYPDTFPHTRVAIYAPDLKLERHQNPFGTNLCAIPKASAYWRPSILAAQLIEDQVPDLVRLARAAKPSQDEVEYPQGEPASVYFPASHAGAILIPESLFSIQATDAIGSLVVALHPDDVWFTRGIDGDDESLMGIGAVVKAQIKSGKVLHDDDSIAKSFWGSPIKARWVLLAKAPLDVDPPLLFETICEERPGLRLRQWQRNQDDDKDFELIAVGYPEEVKQDVWETGWLFLLLLKKGQGMTVWFVRALRYSADHLGERIPELISMRERTVGVAGLGTLGAPICLHLASALIREVRALDYDYFDPATSVRWPAGVRASGQSKAKYLKYEIESQYPLTSVKSFALQVGEAPIDRPNTELGTLESWLTNLDLVVDATAEDNVNRAIAHLVHPKGIPQIYVWSIEGHGGVVSLIRPGETGCYLCLERALSDGTIQPPRPPEKPRRVQPRGCSDPTFVAPGIDLLPLSIEATRFAFAALTGESGYPKPDYDVLVFEIRNPDGSLHAPLWRSWKLGMAKGCSLCETAA